LGDIAPGERPAPDSDEAGLWMYMDRIEARLKSSGRVVTDPALNDYLREILCRLTPEHCRDIRLYIVETPHFNATMAPNGCMEVWTGLLVRADNEAQLAYVLAHEMGHYLRRHSVQLWRTARTTSDVLAFFSLATSAAGVGYAGSLAQLAALGGLFAYSRDQEREADEIGFDLMVEAGYEPAEAPRLWEKVIAERDAADEPEQFIFLASHPATEERIETLKRMAASIQADDVNRGRRQRQFQETVRPFRAVWLRGELNKNDFAATQIVLDGLRRQDDKAGEIHYFQGELYRLRGEPGDAEQAIISYRHAIQLGDVPPETHRALGLVCWRSGLHAQARDAFEAYLAGCEDAPDRAIIESYIHQLQ
jgi:hypothetical protein